MKTITVSDKDYETIMELSKELQLQENDGQAFPYFWSPRSTKWGIGTDDDEEVFHLDGTDYAAKELFEEDEDLRDRYLETIKRENPEVEFKEQIKFKDIDPWSWEFFLETEDHVKHYRREEEVRENNFSLFKSDVKDHIECNAHHLGNKPHTYANTIFRMPKMEQLIECFYRLNPQKNEKINQEAERFVLEK